MMNIFKNSAMWNIVDVISLDHDLGEDTPTGYDVLKMLEQMAHEEDRRVPFEILIHSANPVGRKNMEAAIASIQRI